MVWYSHLSQNFPQLIVIHTVKGFVIVNKAEINVFLECSCFFDDPVDVGNLISGSPAFPKPSLNIWNFMIHILLKLLKILQKFNEYISYLENGFIKVLLKYYMHNFYALCLVAQSCLTL